MIICPNCGTKQIEGTLFCNDCGADLTGLEEGIDPNLDLSRESKYTTANIPPSNFSIPVIPQGTFPVAPPAPVSGPVRKDLKLVVLNTGRRMECPDRSNIIIGRSDAVSGETPDIDLTPDDALELGVSRRHACITFRDGVPFLTDLGSTNRTFINRQVLMRGQPSLLKDGDEIRMGNAIIKVLFKPDAK
ncbi:MAG: FHA domain-containing protein [Chloroflexi bacterium]|uniref:FHA domain-containing protein n=1 Tax=Candidatus Chlorohelix allophototropha TaxID=3003348 RepID=A0A8T7M8N5_9CHLR|nr:FHA domain-containing protein [Chloroflexota bacterium]WJW68297.1 FHA domain-containing protein [Chloroflexota bacterium L227-S17]